MSGNEETTTRTAFGPRQATRLELMGIRFLNDDPNNPGAGDPKPAEPNPDPDSKLPQTQEELSRIIQERLARATAPFKDYADLKTKAEQFDALQGKGSGTADDDVTRRLNEAATRAENAERTANETSVKLLRSEVALDKGITKDDLVLLTATTREDLVAQADRIVKLNAGSGRVPGQGGRDSSSTTGGGVSAGKELFENSRKKSTT
jgi:hypothetical protein